MASNSNARQDIFSLIILATLLSIGLLASQETIWNSKKSKNNTFMSIHRILDKNSFHVRNLNGKIQKAVIISSASHQYHKYVKNLLCTVHRATGRNYVLYALDQKMYTEAKLFGIPVIKTSYAHSSLNMSDIPYNYGSVSFNIVAKLKFLAVRDALLAGFDVVFTDVDVVWCEDAVLRISQSLRNNTWAHIAIQNGRSTNLHWPVEPNTGFFYAKSNKNVIDMFEHLIEMSEDTQYAHNCDQQLFSKFVCSSRNGARGMAINRTISGRPSHACKWDNRVNVDILPLETFPNGHSPLGTRIYDLPVGVLQKACKEKKIALYHNNWCSGGGKEARMDKHKLWNIDKNEICVNFE